MTATTDTWLNALYAHVGEVESPGGSNCCPVCRAYGPIGSARCYAWCCATQDLVLEQTFGVRLLGTAAVGQAWVNAQAGLNGLVAVDHNDEIWVGDLYCMDLKGHGNWNDMHIGGVVNPDMQSTFGGIEGNWGNACVRKQRDRKYVYGFIRPPFDLVVPTPAPIPPTSQEDAMQFTYARRKDDGQVYVVRHGIAPFPVGAKPFGYEAAEDNARSQGDGILQHPNGEDNPDAFGKHRKVLVVDAKEAQQWYGLA